MKTTQSKKVIACTPITLKKKKKKKTKCTVVLSQFVKQIGVFPQLNYVVWITLTKQPPSVILC